MAKILIGRSEHINRTDYTRREFIKASGLGIAAAAIPAYAFSSSAPGPKQSERKPNVLLIMTDDQGWGDLHSHGNDKIDTPVLDKFATDGARFDSFFVSATCAPTRASLLTGRYYLRTGTHGVTRGRENMRAEEVTIAEVLKAAGYATSCFGKWHNGSNWPYHPNAQGFDEFVGFCAGNLLNYFDTNLEHNGTSIKTTGYISDVLTDFAITFIENNKDQPFFCYVPYNAPHSPFQVPDKYFDKYKARGLDDILACIYGMCENLD
ncbi:MAG: sulfatase-like hydrolase/transferase, partial [Planctomycetota bacterium]